MPHDSHNRSKVEEALLAADRLAAECDRRQVFDLQAMRRRRSQGKKTTKRRPVSMGSGVMVTPAWNWFGSD